MSTELNARETRILNPRPRHHYRRAYSLAEVRIGAGVLLLLVAIAAWVAWRGAHPDPQLFAEVAAAQAPPAPIDRGALPNRLGTGAWSEGPLAHFDAANLYVKIDGRADFFLSRGFKALTSVSLTRAAPSATVDVEFYDMGSSENALGALAGEKPAETPTQSTSGSQWYRARNALFLARGNYYVRILGSDESAPVLAQLIQVQHTLEAGIAGADRPWSHGLFADALGLAPDRIGFERENAFSFGFAHDVWIGRLPDGDTELFVTPTPDAAAAQALARQFEDGFASYGEKQILSGATWIKDRYLGSYARATIEGAFVIGVRGASEPRGAAAALEKLRSGVARLPAGLAARVAQAEAPEPDTQGGPRE